jgi:hypothetical protein
MSLTENSDRGILTLGKMEDPLNRNMVGFGISQRVLVGEVVPEQKLLGITEVGVIIVSS